MSYKKFHKSKKSWCGTVENNHITQEFFCYTPLFTFFFLYFFLDQKWLKKAKNGLRKREQINKVI